MGEELDIFVDESGLPSRGEHYTVAACWCVSSSTVYWRALKPTVDRLTRLAEDLYHGSAELSELRGARLSSETLNGIVPNIGEIAFEDKTLHTADVPWDLAYPIRFTRVRFHPNLTLEVIGGSGSAHPDAARRLQTIALISVLDPLLQAEQLTSRGYSRVKITLDADVWTGPATTLAELLNDISEIPGNVLFKTHDSRKVVGLQIADLAAYAWGRQSRMGDCTDAVSHLEHLRLPNLSTH